MASQIIIGLTILLTFVRYSIACSYNQPQWTGAAFWNRRYQMGYDEAEPWNGLWSYNCDLRGYHSVVDYGYGRHYNDYLTSSCHGCSCQPNARIVDCTTPTSTNLKVYLKSIGYMNDTIGPGFFSEDFEEITVIRGSLETFVDNPFRNSTKLTRLTIHDTKVTTIPDLSNCTLLVRADFSRNKIFFDFTSYERPLLPSSLTYLNLIENDIEWLPDGIFSGTNIRFLALSANKIGPLIPSESFANMESLEFLSLDANNLKEITRTETDMLGLSPIRHLNVSNNQINYVGTKAFDQMKNLTILELQQNDIGDIESCIFQNLPAMKHIDLSHNQFTGITRNTFSNLPELKRVRLHNNNIKFIDTYAFEEVPRIQELFLGSNRLPNFPHAVFDWRNWPSLSSIHADTNDITSLEQFGEESFPYQDWELYCFRLQKFEPFRGLTNLHHLNVNRNKIREVKSDTFRNIPKLIHLNMRDNLLTTLHEDLFLPTPNIVGLHIAGNDFQYVPPAIKGKKRMPSIREIGLSRNEITFIETGDFSEHDTLEELWLNGNKILTIENASFPSSLWRLEIHSSDQLNFKQTDPFSNATSMRYLRLSNNAIDNLPRGLFRNMTKLRDLYLQNNKIGMIPADLIQNSPDLVHIYLQNNEIAFMEDGVFRHLDTLRHFNLHKNWVDTLPSPSSEDFTNLTITQYSLTLSDNRIERIMEYQFVNVIVDDHFTLNNNRISTIKSHAFTNIRVGEDINLNNNGVKYLESYAFDNVQADELFLSHLNTEVLPNSAFHNVRLRNLIMNRGFIGTLKEGAFKDVTINDRLYMDGVRMHTIEGQIFDGSSKVSIIHLENNELVTIPVEAFKEVTVNQIRLANNKLTTYPTAINEHQLKEIDLSGNQIRSLPVNAFLNQNKAKTVLLNGNQITSLDRGVFDFLSSAEIIDLSENFIISIEDGVFSSSLTTLKELYLQDNQIIHFPVLEDMPSLEIVNLTKNSLSTFGNLAFSAVKDTLTNVIMTENNAVSCSCVTVRALFDIHDIITDGECGEPAIVLGVQLNSSETNNFVAIMNTTSDYFLCSGDNLVGRSSDALDITLSWKHPPYLYYDINNATYEPEGVPLATAIECNCINITVNTTTNETAIICGPGFLTEEECINQTISYKVTCTSFSAPSFTNYTNGLEYRFHPAEAGSSYECYVQLKFNGTLSTISRRSTVQVLDARTNIQELDDNVTYWLLPSTHYDFSVNHNDFDGSYDVKPSNPDYLASPFESTVSSNSLPTLVNWFRTQNGVNIPFESNIVLQSNTTDRYRFFDAEFYPLDGLGYRAEGQKDCGSKLHNFGSGLFLNGGEIITVGGGDLLWLYINGYLVVELSNVANSPLITCASITLGQPSNGFVKFEISEGFIISEQCVTSTSYSKNVDLQAEAGEIYHFSVFVAEREACTSQLLLETQHVQFNLELQNKLNDNAATATSAMITSETTTHIIATTAPTTATDLSTTQSEEIANSTITTNESTSTVVIEATTSTTTVTESNIGESSTRPPVDLSISIAENLAEGSFVIDFTLSDASSLGPPFLIYISEGNEQGKFYLSEFTVSNQTELPPPNGTVREFENVTFIECDTIPEKSPAPATFNLPELTVTDSRASLHIQSELDYEEETLYYLQISIRDPLANRNGTLLVKIKVTDINDNCPIANSSSTFQTYLDFPLSPTVPFVTFNVTDKDSEPNAMISYTIGQVQKSGMDVNQVGLGGNSYLTFELLVADSGTPRLGRTISTVVEVSNTCLYDPRFRDLIYYIEGNVINQTIGQLYLRVPGYFGTNEECSEPVGFQDHRVRSDMITSSSNYFLDCGPRYRPWYGRLHGYNFTDNNGKKRPGGWVANSNDLDQWFQVDFGETMRLRELQMQGVTEHSFWITAFILLYGNDGVNWNVYLEDKINKTLSDSNCSLTNNVTSNDTSPHFCPSYEAETCLANNNCSIAQYGINQTDPNVTIYLSANNDSDSISQTVFTYDILARYIRILPVAWHGGIGLRMEMIGCKDETYKKVRRTCKRCPSSYYCPGDGQLLPCGRCVDNNVTACNQRLTEFSYGGSMECRPCPTGMTCKDGFAKPCPQYHYAEPCNETICPECKICEPGNSCRNGEKFHCKPGTFSSDGIADFCASCPAGTYSDRYAMSDCKFCPRGYSSYCQQTRCFPCSSSEWSDIGDSGCKACVEGQCSCSLRPSPCFPGVQCVNTIGLNASALAFHCLECPIGYTGDGVNCSDIDECLLSNPCVDQSLCVNTQGGFHCKGCPVGFTGELFIGHGLNDTTPSQICFDIDECSTEICDPLVECNNSIGSYLCGQCPLGYSGTGYIGCWKENPCTVVLIRSACGETASCLGSNNYVFSCKCNDGFAGNGGACGEDQDNDGYPDEFIQCSGSHCDQDNCPTIPNSGQEDEDGDRQGDACDNDDDNDFIPDHLDNCPLVKNYVATGHQLDSDDDGFGDECDTCPNKSGQFPDTDGDGYGDGCDNDDDNDGVEDNADLCPFDPAVTNIGADTDGDNIGDACDNCQFVSNANQNDKNQNGIGDSCDDNKDRDGDGILDFLDNCPDSANPSQSDSDNDGSGDVCDNDIDNDGKLDSSDHCPFVPDPNVFNDSTCINDFDLDGINDTEDSCRKDPTITHLNLITYTIVNLNSGTQEPNWQITDQGREVTQFPQIPFPAMLIGPQGFADFDYQASVYVQKSTIGNYVGLVFGYHNNREFYVVMWRHDHRNDDDNKLRVGLKGIQIKAVVSNSGPSNALSQAVWHTDDTNNQVTLIYHDPVMHGWIHEVAYTFQISHRPSTGTMRVIIRQGAHILYDSGKVFDSTFSGGRIGVFVHSQPNVIWSKMKVKCVERENEALYFDGIDDYVQLPPVENFRMQDSFTIEVWYKSANDYNAITEPIICTQNGTELCLYTQNSVLFVTFNGIYNIEATQSVTSETWHHAVVRYDAENCILTLFTNGTVLGEVIVQNGVKNVNWEPVTTNNNFSLFLGTDTTNYFHGTIDDVRIYDRALLDAELTKFVANTGLTRQHYQRFLTGHYTMDYHTDNATLKDLSYLSNDGVINGPSFVESTSDYARYRVAFPYN